MLQKSAQLEKNPLFFVREFWNSLRAAGTSAVSTASPAKMTAGAGIFERDEKADPVNETTVPGQPHGVIRFDCIAFYWGDRRFPLQVVIRIDQKNKLISGDVFSKSNQPRQFILGGRDDWRYSFRGSFKARQDKIGKFVAICDVPSQSDGKTHAAAIEFTMDGQQLTSFRFERISTSQGSWQAAENWDMDPERVSEPSTNIRRINLRYALAASAGGHDDLVKRVLSDQGSVWTILQKSGIHATFEQVELNYDPAECHLDPIHKVSDMVSSIGPAAPDPDVDWSHLIAFVSRHEDHKCAHNARFRNGQAFGLELPEHRFRSRFGAYINIGDYVLDEKLGEERVLSALVLHELGHMLNIPHAWRRHLGHPLLGEARPDALTVMNYSRYHPIGPVFDAKLPWAAECAPIPPTNETKKQILDRRKSRFFRRLGSTGYDTQERHFLLHAPLDHIAQGGRTFLDHKLKSPKFEDPGEAALQLIDSRPGPSNKEFPLTGLELSTWIISGERELQPIPLMVKLPDQADIQPDFRFETGAVQLLIRMENGSSEYDEEQPVIAYDPSMELEAAWATRASELKSGAAGIERLAPERMVSSPALQLPWVRESFAKSTTKRFTMQIVYYQRPLIYRSKLFKVSFDEEVEWIGDRREFKQAKLGDDRNYFMENIVSSQASLA